MAKIERREIITVPPPAVYVITLDEQEALVVQILLDSKDFPLGVNDYTIKQKLKDQLRDARLKLNDYA